MPDFVSAPKPALAHAPLCASDGSFVLEPLPQGRLIQALASPSADAHDVVARLSDVAGTGLFAVRPYAPGQWFVIGDAPLVPGEAAQLEQAVGTDVALSDQSHGRTRLALEGTRARDVLACGCALDLADAAFPVGRSAQTLFGHVGVHVTRTEPERFELVVLRSFAADLWEELAQAGAAFLPGTAAS